MVHFLLAYKIGWLFVFVDADEWLNGLCIVFFFVRTQDSLGINTSKQTLAEQLRIKKIV